MNYLDEYKKLVNQKSPFNISSIANKTREQKLYVAYMSMIELDIKALDTNDNEDSEKRKLLADCESKIRMAKSIIDKV